MTVNLVSGTNSSNSNLYFRDGSGTTNGTLALVKTGAGTLDFSSYSAMSYSGGLTVNGGVLAFNNAAALGSGSMTLGGGTLAVTSGSSVTISNATTLTAATTSGIDTGSGAVTHSGGISGAGALVKYGNGTLTLSGTNTFSGDTFVSAGTLTLAATQALGGSTFDTSSSGSLSFGSLTAANFGGIKASGNLTLSNTAGAAVALTVGGNNQSNSFPGTLSGPGSLIKSGSGTLTLTGSNTYTGSTTVNGGVLQIGDGISAVSIASSSGITDNAALVFNLVGNQNYGGAISGTGALTKNGGGTLTLSGSNAFTGAITLGSGTLQIGDGLGGSLAGGSVAMNPGTTLNVNLPDGGTMGSAIYSYGNVINFIAGGTNTFSGQIYGYVSGVINQSGTGTTVLSGNNDFGGTTNINAGALQLNGTFAAYNSTVNVGIVNGLVFCVNRPAIGALSGSGSFVLLNGTNGVTLTAGGNNASTTYAGTISGTSSGSSLTKSGAGTLTLTGSSTYAGPTTISAGTLQLGDGTGGHDGSLSTSALTDNGMLVYNVSGSETVSYPMSGSGGLTKSGAGVLTLTSSTLNFVGPMSIASGTLILASSTNTNLSSASITIASGAKLINNNFNAYAPANCVLSVQSGGTLTENAPTFVAGYLVAPSGAIINGSYATVSLTGADSGSLKTAVFGSISIGRILDGLASSGTQTLQFDGTGTGASIGTVSVRPTGSGPSIHNMDIGHSSSAIGGVDVTVPILELRPSTGSLAFNKLGAGVLQINGFGFTGSAPNTNNPVSCEVSGGKLILSATGTNGNGVNFASVMVDSGATLQVGAGGTTGAVYVDIANNGTVDFKRSDTYTFSNGISGSGSLTQSGSGTLILAGVNTYDGATTISSGTLELGTANALPSGVGKSNVSLAATLDLNGFNLAINGLSGSGTVKSGTAGVATLTVGNNDATSSFGGVIQNGSGTIGLVKTGGGTLTLSGSNSHSGGTTLNDGILQVGNTHALGAASNALTINCGTLDLNGHSVTVGVLSGSTGALITNSISGTNTLTTTISSGTSTYDGNIANGTGAVTLTKQGGGTLALSGSVSIAALNANDGVTALAGSSSISSIDIGASGTLSMAAHTGSASNVIDTSALAFSGTTGTTAVLDDLQVNGVLTIMVYDNSQRYLDTFAEVGGLGSFDEIAGDPIDFNQVLLKGAYLGTLDGAGLPSAAVSVAGIGTAPASPEAVPEPGTLGLLLAGALGLLGRRLLRRTTRS